MAHDHPPSPGFGGAGHAAHASPDDEYVVTPPGAGHEHTDAHVGVIVKFAIWLIVSAVVVHVGVWGLFLFFAEQREETAASQPYPVAIGQGPRQPAAPRLQQFPVNELYEFRQQEAQRLDGYRWVDRAAGRVQIPIAEAMRLTLERGLPSRTPAPGDQSGVSQPADPALIPADSSAGRTMERRR